MWKQLYKMVVIAGCLDIAAACIHAYLVNGTLPSVVLRYIASGWFGKEAFSGNMAYAIFGLLVHFFIVFAIALTYFYLYPKLGFLHRSMWLSSILLAVAAWAVTTRIIIPLSRIETPPFNFFKVLTAVTILIFCIGLPIAYYTAKYYRDRGAS